MPLLVYPQSSPHKRSLRHCLSICALYAGSSRSLLLPRSSSVKQFYLSRDRLWEEPSIDVEDFFLRFGLLITALFSLFKRYAARIAVSSLTLTYRNVVLG